MSIPSFIHPINSVLNQPFHIEIIVDTHAIVRNNTEKTRASLTQLPPVVTACKTTVQPHHPDTEHFHRPTIPCVALL